MHTVSGQKMNIALGGRVKAVSALTKISCIIPYERLSASGTGKKAIHIFITLDKTFFIIIPLIKTCFFVNYFDIIIVSLPIYKRVDFCGPETIILI